MSDPTVHGPTGNPTPNQGSMPAWHATPPAPTKVGPSAPPYPVVQIITLPRLTGIFKRRPADSLPNPGAGFVVVAGGNGEYHVFPDQYIFRGNESEVVRAASLTVVNVQRHPVDVLLMVPTKNGLENFTVKATFSCEVVDPTHVAKSRYTDLGRKLSAHLGPHLGPVGRQFDLDEVSHARSVIDAHVKAAVQIDAPSVTGLSINMIGLSISTPPELGKVRSQIDKNRELAAAEAVQDRIDQRGEGLIMAAGLGSGEISTEDLTATMLQRTREREMISAEIARELIDKGHFDRNPDLAEQIVEDVIGRVIGGGGANSGYAIGSGNESPGLGSGTKKEDDLSEPEPLPPDPFAEE